MRVSSLVALFTSIALSALPPGSAKDKPSALYITTTFLIAVFVPKSLQKFAEARFPACS